MGGRLPAFGGIAATGIRFSVISGTLEVAKEID
jgi:hypothetical protein